MTVRPHLLKHQFKPMERADAMAAGNTTYFTGRPCKNGHVDYRCTSSGACITCSKASQKKTAIKRLLNNPNYYKQKYKINSEIFRQKAAKYREEHPDRIKASAKKSSQKRKPQKAAAQMMRFAYKLNATPKWLSKHDIELIDAYYKAAQQHKESLGIVLSVDHIVPLRGKTVCGLHVPWNLCLRTKADNSKKSNKLTNDAYIPKQTGILVAESALPWNLKKEVLNDNAN
jgi:hypothetical protein